jgi:hypothetical protein
MRNGRVNPTILLFSGRPMHRENEISIEWYGAEAFQIALYSLIQGIGSDDNEVQQAALEELITIGKP